MQHPLSRNKQVVRLPAVFTFSIRQSNLVIAWERFVNLTLRLLLIALLLLVEPSM